jgi:hypothetical protein
MIQGLTQAQVGDLIYLGTFFYEAILREDNLIDDSKNTVAGVVSYPKWESYMLDGLSEAIENDENIKIVRRYLPNAFIRSKATLLGTLTLSRGVTDFDAWRHSVLTSMDGDETTKVEPYLSEVFQTSQRLIREARTKPQTRTPQPLENFFTMNRNQRIALIAGAVIFVLMLLVPPWHYSTGRSYGYRFLFWPPARSIFIDSTRLIVQCVLVTAVTLGSFVLLKSKRN